MAITITTITATTIVTTIITITIAITITTITTISQAYSVDDKGQFEATDEDSAARRAGMAATMRRCVCVCVCV